MEVTTVQLRDGNSTEDILLDTLVCYECQENLPVLDSKFTVPNLPDIVPELQTFKTRATRENTCNIAESRSIFTNYFLDRAVCDLINTRFGAIVAGTFDLAQAKVTRNTERLIEDTIYVNDNSLLGVRVTKIVRIPPTRFIIRPFVLRPKNETGDFTYHQVIMVIDTLRNRFYFLDPNGLGPSAFLTGAMAKTFMELYAIDTGFNKAYFGVNTAYGAYVGTEEQRPLYSQMVQNRLDDRIIGLHEGICRPLSYFLVYMALITGQFYPWSVANVVTSPSMKQLTQQAINGFYQTLLLLNTAFQAGKK